ncbi:MAG: hypothetical protein H5U40_19110, partial [Polyangiaceae bacterium]|nr:hypothetical protein [Polyangiaceae bacterium]
MLRKAAVACLALVALGALILAFWSKLPTPLPWQRPRGAPSLDAPPVAIPAPPRALIVGTGSEPASTQVSIEQDVALAAEILRAPALVLFAGGRGAQSVVELDSDTAPTLRERLGALFGAQNEPSATFRPTRLAPDGPATVNHLLDSLERSLAAGEGPLVVYWAGHGEPGEEPRANLARMWGGFPVGPEDLAEVLEGESTRRQT